MKVVSSLRTLESREWPAKAVVDSRAKREVALRLAANIEHIHFLEALPLAHVCLPS
jgi:hypothetical protein